MVDHVLRTSLEKKSIITIMYLKGNEITKRNVKVLEIDDEFIRAYCYLRKQNRIFKKDNILSAAMINIPTYKTNNLSITV